MNFTKLYFHTQNTLSAQSPYLHSVSRHLLDLSSSGPHTTCFAPTTLVVTRFAEWYSQISHAVPCKPKGWLCCSNTEGVCGNKGMAPHTLKVYTRCSWFQPRCKDWCAIHRSTNGPRAIPCVPKKRDNICPSRESKPGPQKKLKFWGASSNVMCLETFSKSVISFRLGVISCVQWACWGAPILNTRVGRIWRKGLRCVVQL